MRILEIVILVFCLGAVIALFTLIPGGALISMLSLTILGMFYFLFGILVFSGVGLRKAFKGGLKEVSSTVILAGIVGGITLSTVTIGILFKILVLPGADQMLAIGTVGCLAVLLLCLIQLAKQRNRTSKLNVARLILFSGLSILLFFTSSLELVKIQYRNHPLYIQAYSAYINDPGNPELREKLDIESYRIRLSAEEFEQYMKSR